MAEKKTASGSKQGSYPVPDGTATAERTVRKSRFVAAVGRAKTAEEAREFVERVKKSHPAAAHNCHAFVACAPGGTATGFGDDGEVSGTAGRPMLSLLEHGGVGEIAAVVSRYFGGVKLGTGGLVRAYSGCLADALSGLSVRERVPVRSGRVVFPPAFENSMRLLFGKTGVEITSVERGREVRFAIEAPLGEADGLSEKIASRTRGEHEIAWDPES